jgi:glycogen(starch) synthase
MRILVVTNLYPPFEHGGYELSCQAFVQHLRAKGHEVLVLTSAPEEPVEWNSSERVDRTLRWYRQTNGSFASPPWLSRCRLERHNRRALGRAIRELDAEAVMWWSMGGMSLSLVEQVRRAGLPALGVICDYWMIWGQEVDPWLRAGRRSSVLARVFGTLSGVPMRVDFNRAARWVFVSEHVRRETMKAIGELPRTGIVPSGIATQRFTVAPLDRTWSGRLLIVGRLTRNKGVDIALEALASLPECTLDIYGRADEQAVVELHRSIGEFGLADRVALHSHIGQADVERLYARYDALLFPIRWDEPFGRVPLEAMASGVPVVAAPRGGARDYLRHEDNCLVAYDAAEVRSAVQRLASDAALRASIAEGGLATVHRYDIAHANEGRERALRQAIAESGGRRGAPR